LSWQVSVTPRRSWITRDSIMMSWLGRVEGVRRFAADAQQMPCVEKVLGVIVVAGQRSR